MALMHHDVLTGSGRQNAKRISNTQAHHSHLITKHTCKAALKAWWTFYAMSVSTALFRPGHVSLHTPHREACVDCAAKVRPAWSCILSKKLHDDVVVVQQSCIVSGQLRFR